MPLLGFSVMKQKLLDGSKTQTIRKPRKFPIQIGEKLYIYWKLRTKKCEKLGEGIVTKIDRKRLLDLTEEEAKKDGFLDKAGLLAWFLNKHGLEGHRTKKFDVITWNWCCSKCGEEIQGTVQKSPNAQLCINCFLKKDSKG